MKSFIYGLAIVLMFGTVVYAVDEVKVEPYKSSGDLSADALIYTGKAVVKQVFIVPDGTNNCSVKLYDKTSASGRVIFPALPCLGTGSGCTTDLNVLAETGIYADMTTVGTCPYNVHYKEYP